MLRRLVVSSQPLRLARRGAPRALLHYSRALCTARAPPLDPPPGASAEDGPRAAEQPEGAKDTSEATQRARLLEAALQFVPEKGWTVDALSAGAVSCGLSPAAHGMLPRGPVELVEHFVSSCDEALAKEMLTRQEELVGLETQNRLLLAMQTRLQMLEPHVGTWSQALALRTLPTNLPGTLQSAHGLATTLLDACGEGAQAPLAPALVDPHVKRVAIGAIYGAAELYMLTDRSPGFSDTWLFIEREVHSLHTAAGVASQLQAYSPANLLLTLMSRR